MSDFILVLSSLKSRWLNSILSVLLTAFGVMLALLIIQFGHHIQNRLSADGQGIDIVVGAKGSPLQLILSSVYHIDIPTGNIPYDEVEKWMKHPQVKTAVPLALGDNWKGYRIAGTTPAYVAHYGAALAEGHIWSKAFEAVAGSSVGLKIGDEFSGAHGLMAGGHEHEDEHYKITGVMKPTGTVLDRLILTSLDSVLEIHGLEAVEREHHHDQQAQDHHEEGTHDDHGNHEEEHSHEHDKQEAHEGHDHKEAGEPEITALLLTTKSPIANINLPRSINRESALQAANPALEMARLTSMLGLGSQSFAALSAILIIIAALSIFAGLAGSLENRMGDLAVLRAIGYSKTRVFKIITLEGMMIVISGLVLGLVMGLSGFALLTRIMTPLQASGASISFTSDFILILLAVLLAGLIAAMLPALRASRVDVARQLSRSA
jgi:putative ABC transport system permease protein